MSLTGKERALLRAECNGLKATVHVGQHGLTPSLVNSLDDALRTRELVKIQLGKPVDQTAREAANVLAERTGAEVIQCIGKTATLYRENLELKRKHGDLPPWRV